VQRLHRYGQNLVVDGRVTDDYGQRCLEEDSEGDHVVLESLFNETYLSHAADSDVRPLHTHDYNELSALRLVVGVHVLAVDVAHPVAVGGLVANCAGTQEHVGEVGVAGLEGTQVLADVLVEVRDHELRYMGCVRAFREEVGTRGIVGAVPAGAGPFSEVVGGAHVDAERSHGPHTVLREVLHVAVPVIGDCVNLAILHGHAG